MSIGKISKLGYLTLFVTVKKIIIFRKNFFFTFFTLTAIKYFMNGFRMTFRFCFTSEIKIRIYKKGFFYLSEN